MIVFKKLLLPLLLLSCYSVNAEVVVIVHPSNSSSFDQSEISKFFLGKAKSFSDGNQAVPINQEDSSTVRKEFDSNVLSKSGSQLKAYWSKITIDQSAIGICPLCAFWYKISVEKDVQKVLSCLQVRYMGNNPIFQFLSESHRDGIQDNHRKTLQSEKLKIKLIISSAFFFLFGCFCRSFFF